MTRYWLMPTAMLINYYMNYSFGVVGLNFGTLLDNKNNYNLYQSRSNEFKIGATLWKHRMFEREHRRYKARVAEWGHATPRKILKTQCNLVTSSTFSCRLFLVQVSPFFNRQS